MIEGLDLVLRLREAGAVRRMHTTRTAYHQTLAEHSWGVAMLVRYVRPAASGDLLHAALVHDLPEWWTGDVPAPCKWAHAELEIELRKAEDHFHNEHGTRIALTPADRALLKWCDGVELALHAYEQRLMGNTYMREIECNIVVALHARTAPAECDTLWQHLLAKGIGS